MFIRLPTAVLLGLLIHCPLAMAQSATGSAAGDAALEVGAEVLKREAEAAAGRIFTKDQIDIIRDVLVRTTATDSTTDVETEDNDNGVTKKKRTGGQNKGKGKNKQLPPGLAKKEKLPPGLQKQIERGGTLPPGLAKRQLPDDLEDRLGPPAAGTERVIVDTDVILIEKGTEVILDVIKDVLRRAGS